MIIEARQDVVTLRGTLSENHWDAIAAAVDLVLPEHPQGILLDCGDLNSMSDFGGATFLEGLSYMEARGARIILCNVPSEIQTALRSIPGLHSQVPTAATVEIGRKSLEAGHATPLTTGKKGRVVLVPVNPPFSGAAAQPLLRRLNLGPGAEIHFAYAMVVPRSLPVGAPLPEEEARAEAYLAAAELAMPNSVKSRHVLRARNMPEAITAAIAKLGVAEVIAGIDPASLGDEAVTEMINTLRSRCPCPLTITQDRAPAPVA